MLIDRAGFDALVAEAGHESAVCILDEAHGGRHKSIHVRNKSRAVLRAKVESMWMAVEKDDKGHVPNDKCWEYIMADPELAGLLGNGDAALGRTVLDHMKGARSLDRNYDGGTSSLSMCHAEQKQERGPNARHALF